MAHIAQLVRKPPPGAMEMVPQLVHDVPDGELEALKPLQRQRTGVGAEVGSCVGH
jgi:hypothetical protein